MGKKIAVLVPVGESLSDAKGTFCGWYDSPLTQTGEEEAKAAGRQLKEARIHLDTVHSSVLTRCTSTLSIILHCWGEGRVKIYKSWMLNDKHMGVLTRMTRSAALSNFGSEKVWEWVQGWDEAPPPLDAKDALYEQFMSDTRYKDGPQADKFPLTESLEAVQERVVTYWLTSVVPEVKLGRTPLIVAHKHTLRAFVKYMEGIPNSDIQDLTLLGGVPFIYELDKNIESCKPHYFLTDQNLVLKAMEAEHNKRKALYK